MIVLLFSGSSYFTGVKKCFELTLARNACATNSSKQSSQHLLPDGYLALAVSMGNKKTPQDFSLGV